MEYGELPADFQGCYCRLDDQHEAAIAEISMKAKVTSLRFNELAEVRKYIALVRKNPAAYHCDRCILCSGSADRLGCFIPDVDKLEKFGAKPGTDRGILYGLCAACAATDGFVARIEEQLLADLTAEDQRG